MATFRLGLHLVNLTSRLHQSTCTALLLPKDICGGEIEEDIDELLSKIDEIYRTGTKFSSCFSRLTSPTNSLAVLQSPTSSHSSSIHTTADHLSYRNTEFEDRAPTKVQNVNLKAPTWLRYNEAVYAPTKPGEPERPAEICHSRFQIKYSRKKMWYISVMIRGMSIDEAIKQLAFHKKKGAAHVKEVLEEAQEMAVRDHNVEFKSNLWIADSFCTKGITVKGVRRHAKRRYCIIRYRYTNYFVRLREGLPPKHYYAPEKTGHELMADHIQKLRERKISCEL